LRLLVLTVLMKSVLDAYSSNRLSGMVIAWMTMTPLGASSVSSASK